MNKAAKVDRRVGPRPGNEELRRVIHEFPNLRPCEIAAQYGVSETRVHQIKHDQRPIVVERNTALRLRAYALQNGQTMTQALSQLLTNQGF